MTIDKSRQHKIHEILDNALRASNKTDEEIAQEVNLDVSMVRSIRRGLAKVTLSKTSVFATAAGLDVAYLIRIAIDEYQPGLLAQTEEVLDGTVLSSNEKKLIDSYRYITRESDATPVVIDRNSVLDIVTN